MVALLCIQIRGECGWHKRELEAQKKRHKFDALEFYKHDLDWFSMSFVFFMCNLQTVVLHSWALGRAEDSETWTDD